ncbi:ribonuclease T [Methylosinus sp. Ce-a6]|uniref:ribonuclease T2 family protein n=1 Tax=Methylosinus sp. Ce-a6 TaxID=2172005 RepID=UPI00135954FD|nr:ribonuclease T [Methylosinus sp. Ce-a6]
MNYAAFAASTLFSLIAASSALAQTPASGTFLAREACAATRSIHGGPSADDAAVAPGKSYTLVGKNKPEATHYLIEVEGADPLRRWIAADCGSIDGAGTTDGKSRSSLRDAFNLLAVSWQPAFCEEHQSKTECASQTPNRFDATNLTLHGLWPQPRRVEYCNVASSYIELDKNGEWDRLPPVALSAATLASLSRVMPGTMSHLERHEWVRHGSCFRGAQTQEAYFARAVALVSQLNASRVRDLFAENIGGTITAEQIKQAFDESFGVGAGDRVQVSCRGSRRAIVEMTIGLVGEIGDTPSLAELIAAAPTTRIGCPSGSVDRVATR